MSKKIIALSLALMLIVTCFAGCEKKEKPEDVTLINGEEYAFVKDANGNIKEDENGNPMVYVLDEKGYFKKNNDGSYQEAPLALPDYIVDGSKMETEDYILTMSADWEATESGKFLLKNSDTTYVAIHNFGGDNDFNQYMTESEDKIIKIVEKAKESNMDAAYKKVEGTMASTKCVMFEFNCSTSGQPTYYSYVGYFEHDGELFKFEYVCQDGKKVKDADTVVNEINSGFKFK